MASTRSLLLGLGAAFALAGCSASTPTLGNNDAQAAPTQTVTDTRTENTQAAPTQQPTQAQSNSGLTMLYKSCERPATNSRKYESRCVYEFSTANAPDQVFITTSYGGAAVISTKDAQPANFTSYPTTSLSDQLLNADIYALQFNPRSDKNTLCVLVQYSPGGAHASNSSSLTCTKVNALS